jgi:hypothetical protein
MPGRGGGHRPAPNSVSLDRLCQGRSRGKGFEAVEAVLESLSRRPLR